MSPSVSLAPCVRVLLGAAALFATVAWAQPPGDRTPPGWRNLDADGDGSLSKDEAPPALRDRFDRVDRDGDGKVSPAEFFAGRRIEGGPRPGQGNGGERPGALLERWVVQRDIEYVPGGHDRQKLDLYFPKDLPAGGPLPLVVWIHGGAWQGGSKEGCPARYLTQHGFVVASVNYRLSQHAVFPAQIEDCKTALRFLRENAAEYGFDGERIGMWGSSAGGHLVSLLGTSGDVAALEGPDLYKDRSSRVQAVCNYYGPTNLLTMGEQSSPNSRIDHDGPTSPESKLLGGPVQERQELAKLASPVTHVDKADPVFLTVHGDEDPVVPVQQGTTFHEALEKAGVDSELYIVKGGGHGGFRDASLEGRVADFFKRTLARQPVAEPAKE